MANRSTLAALHYPEFRSLLAASACATLASRGLALVVGYQVYEITHEPLSLGWLGLVEAIPALSLALYGGHIADRHDRRSILRITLTALVLCALTFAMLARESGEGRLLTLYAVVFVAGVARGFAEPSAAALEAQLVPREVMVNASSWLSSCWQGSAILGPVLAGFSYAHLGVYATYLAIAGLYAIAWLAVSRIQPRRPTPHAEGETIWESIATGVRFVVHDQVLLSSMALDLFAVLFGGAIALLPVFAADILDVGPEGLGWLNAAPGAGALLTMLWATRHPPVRNAGRTLILAVAGFGVSMIVFALSTSFALSMIALFFSGLLDGISMVIRRSILRLLSPEHLRGRIAAVSMIFIGSSNELGAFESGVAANLFGTVRSVWLGGVMTLVVVALATALAPRLRNLHLDPKELARSEPVD